jgi:PHS family inorganic phosphate transporter-like MFS transporter
MSASITSDRSNIRKRGTMLPYIFSNQGWGSFVGSLATIIVLLCYKGAMEGRGETSKVDGGTYFLLDRFGHSTNNYG